MKEKRHGGENEKDMTYSESGEDSDLPGLETRNKVRLIGWDR